MTKAYDNSILAQNISVSGSNTNVSGVLQVNNVNVSVSGHIHTASQISDFASAVSGYFPPSGSQGVQGAQGVIGSNGSQGIQGTQGITGSNGSQGVQGAQGITGSTGSQGIQGTQGLQGIQGIQGTQGVQGIQGIFGSTGSQGGQGIQGLQGVDGSQSVTTSLFSGSGIQFSYDGTNDSLTISLSGTVQGAQGTQGISGSNGSQGVQGIQGISGSNGSQGIQGITGSGSQGTQGIQGIVGGAQAITTSLLSGDNIQFTYSSIADSLTISVTGIAQGTQGVKGIASTYSTTIGDGTNTTYTVTHSLGVGSDSFVIVRDTATNYYVYPDIVYVNTNSIQVIFASAPTTNQYRVTVIGV